MWELSKIQEEALVILKFEFCIYDVAVRNQIKYFKTKYKEEALVVLEFEFGIYVRGNKNNQN